eukprot:174675-Prorocentrum_lima.AAC.1
MDGFWLRAQTSQGFKIYVWNAVIKSKLLYGAASMQLTQTQRDMLNTFQLNGLRKILRLQATY